jgi:enoyl-CoA hydratase/3-hydroxyacyl-CoA dehydrogenase
VKGKDAFNLGLVDGLVSPDQLVNTARQWALDILDRRRPWIASLYKSDKIEPLGEAREILKFARAQARKQAPNLKHPLVCIDVIEAGIVSGPRARLWKVIAVSSIHFLPFILLCRKVYDIVFDL